MKRRFILAGATSLCLPARLAAAHAHLLSASPAAGSVNAGMPGKLICRFSEALEVSLCRLEVRGPTGARADGGKLALGADRRQLELTLQVAGVGDYSVTWVAVSVDTHRTEGKFTFSVTG